jgi:hypothetical protein
MNQRKIPYQTQNATPNGEGSTALPVSLNFNKSLFVILSNRMKRRIPAQRAGDHSCRPAIPENAFRVLRDEHAGAKRQGDIER